MNEKVDTGEDVTRTDGLTDAAPTPRRCTARLMSLQCELDAMGHTIHLGSGYSLTPGRKSRIRVEWEEVA